MADVSINVNWEIATTGVSVMGNDAHRTDATRQTTTFGPEPPEQGFPPETSGGTMGEVPSSN